MSTAYSLSDRYLAENGRVFLSGIQALVRIPIEQLRLDLRAGRRTAAFVSGYPGSPLGGFDLELSRARRLVGDLNIVHVPAVNEELAATAVMGSQLAAERPDLRPDGVIGVWYGKAPGLDRATDALRHATFAGASPSGGAIALVGDDPACKSSTMPSSSDASLVDLQMPVLYPGTVAECLELGLHGIAMSRATGLWSALKVVTPIADATETVDLPILAAMPITPCLDLDGQTWRPKPSAQFLGARMIAVEEEFHDVRFRLAHDYGLQNRLNRVTVDPPDAWLGCIATGYTYYELREAFRRLGLKDDKAIFESGIRLMYLKMPVPFDNRDVAHFARGLEEVLIVEEKNPTLERLIRDALYSSAERPLVLGKKNPDGSRLIPSHGLLDADAILPALRFRLEPRLADRLPPHQVAREPIPLSSVRTPFFCSGCPHNWGTKVPEGAVVGMGTGCHGMTLLMDQARVGESIGITAMGNEGAQWLGMAPFVETDHVFQNLGDGTYFHSGQLAVQAAVAANVNMTFKILYNSTVAMTGGQQAAHSVAVRDLATILLAHGVKEVGITTEDPRRYRGLKLPKGVAVSDRNEIVALQQRLSSIRGVTVLIHDQECAADLRRRRKRSRTSTPDFRVVINHRICEGCGDCGDVSNCLSVQPIDTPLGRKTRIDQESCNFDTSCLSGDCPAFMTVRPRSDRSAQESSPSLENIDVADPPPPTVMSSLIRLAGIGGTGVVSAAQIIGTAAMLDGWNVDGLDQTGLSQKAGPVVSDLTLSHAGPARRSKLVGRGQADLLLAFDQLVAASPGVIVANADERTVTVASTTVTPVGAQISNPKVRQVAPEELGRRLESETSDGRYLAVDAALYAHVLTGVQTTANVFLVGVAVQKGYIPITPHRLREAVTLNGVEVDANIGSFEWGRRWAANPGAVDRLVASRANEPYVDTKPLPEKLADRVTTLVRGTEHHRLLEMLTADLVDYQDSSYAEKFLDLLRKVQIAATDAGDKSGRLLAAVASGYHKLLAYKDEYEVARLMLSPDGLAAAREVGGDRMRVAWHLHPPALRGLGIHNKTRFPGWSRPVFKLLSRGKRLRGTPFDPFGRAHVRRLERALAFEYAATINQVIERLTADNLDCALKIAALPDMVRGYESLKVKRAEDYRGELTALLDQFFSRTP